jgi:hypothetical protein
VKNILPVGALVLTLLSACGSEVELRTLTQSDVTGMTAGNATGTTFSGTYVVDSAALDGCRCRSGSCREFHAQTGSTLTVQQQDGAFSVNGDCVGGVNEDGTFWCGGAKSDGVQFEFGANTGKFTATAGNPSRLDVETETTVVTSIGGLQLDCDIKGHGSARFLAP